MYTDVEYAVKIIDKIPGHSRARVFKEIDTFHHCQVNISFILSQWVWFSKPVVYSVGVGFVNVVIAGLGSLKTLSKIEKMEEFYNADPTISTCSP